MKKTSLFLSVVLILVLLFTSAFTFSGFNPAKIKVKNLYVTCNANGYISGNVTVLNKANQNYPKSPVFLGVNLYNSNWGYVSQTGVMLYNIPAGTQKKLRFEFWVDNTFPQWFWVQVDGLSKQVACPMAPNQVPWQFPDNCFRINAHTWKCYPPIKTCYWVGNTLKCVKVKPKFWYP